MMFQNAGEQFTMETPRQEIIFALENLQVNKNEYEKKGYTKPLLLPRLINYSIKRS